MSTKKIILPYFFKPKKFKNLVRLGKINDGGYLVEKDDIYNSDLLISFGISDDWSFEEDFYSHNKVNIYAYDGSLSKKFWIKKYFHFFFNFQLNRFLDYFKFKNFFKGNKYFKKKFISFYNDSCNINLNNIFENIDPKKKSFNY